MKINKDILIYETSSCILLLYDYNNNSFLVDYDHTIVLTKESLEELITKYLIIIEYQYDGFLVTYPLHDIVFSNSSTDLEVDMPFSQKLCYDSSTGVVYITDYVYEENQE